MKGKFTPHVLLVLVFIGITSCFEPPEFPTVPAIAFHNLYFKEVSPGADSLVLTFRFEDGDGDIGLNFDDTYPPYHSTNYIKDSKSKLVEYNDYSVEAPLYAYAYGFDDYQGVYSETVDFPPYSCADYALVTDIFADSTESDRVDTLLIEKNPYSKNIYVDFYRKERDGYVLINNNFSQGNCPELFDSRIPVFEYSDIGKSVSGSISFAMLSQGFISTFRSDSIKVSFFVYDRALNKSNVAESNDFLLEDITID